MHFFSSDQPMLYSLLCTHPSSTTNVLITLRCLSVHEPVGVHKQHSLDRLQTYSFFQLHTLVLCCPSLPIDHPGLFQQHILHILRASHSYVHRHLHLKQQGVPLWPLDAKIASFAHDRLSWPCHLFPSPCLKNLHPPRFSAAPFTTCSSKSSTSKLFTSKKRDKETDYWSSGFWHLLSNLWQLLVPPFQTLSTSWADTPSRILHYNAEE